MPAPTLTRTDALTAALGATPISTPFGGCLHIQRRYPLDHRHGDRRLGAALARSPQSAFVLSGEPFDPRTAAYFDLETTGLSTELGALPFLIGLARYEGDEVCLDQWLLREPDDEPAALSALSQAVADRHAWVTFNGRLFDVPLLLVRLKLHRLPVPPLTSHLDLLPPSRKLLKAGLPNCKLSTLEARVLGVRRVGDIPGAEVAARYRAYLFGESPEGLLPVVAHNRDDVLSLLTLEDALRDRVDDAVAWLLAAPESSLGVAKLALQTGELLLAETLYRAAQVIPNLAQEGTLGLAKVARKRAKAQTR